MEKNVLFNTGHLDFKAVEIVLETPVWWDERLFDRSMKGISTGDTGQIPSHLARDRALGSSWRAGFHPELHILTSLSQLPLRRLCRAGGGALCHGRFKSRSSAPSGNAPFCAGSGSNILCHLLLAFGDLGSPNALCLFALGPAGPRARNQNRQDPGPRAMRCGPHQSCRFEWQLLTPALRQWVRF